MSTGSSTDVFLSSAISPQVEQALLPVLFFPCVVTQKPHSQEWLCYSTLLPHTLQYVRLHGIERVRGVRKSPRRKISLYLAHKFLALSLIRKLNGHAAFVVGRARGRRAKLT